MIKKYTHYSVDVEDNILTVMYPDGDVFLRERNNITLTALSDDVALVSIKIGGKIINFGKYYFWNAPVVFDVSPYYSKDDVNSIYITIIDGMGLTEAFTINLTLTKHDCYSPFLEVVPDSCGDAPYARIVPPNRMLWDGKKETSSLLSAMRDGDYFSGYEYEMDGVPYENFRPSDKWVTTSQKNAHLGETYHNTLKSTGNLAELDGNGNPLWIEQGDLFVGGSHKGKTFEQQRYDSAKYCRTKTIFNNYKGLTIGATPNGIQMLVVFYDNNRQYIDNLNWRNTAVTISSDSTYKYISITYRKPNGSAITPSELVTLTSSQLTNPEAGKSWRWYSTQGTFKWQEITQEQLVNNKFYWSVNNKSYSNDVINKGFTFGSKFSAKLIRTKNIFSPISWTPLSTIYSIDRSVELVNGDMHYIYARWLTPWGISVEHLFYLDTYGTGKDNAKEVDSDYYYKELSTHLRTGSFYLDDIRHPYDLWYYKTLENSELVELYLPIFSVRKDIYMPNASDYVAVKIKGSNIKDAVVDGVTQSTITFDFEMR